MILTILWVALVATQSQYQWADSRYPLAACNGTLPNRLGTLLMASDLDAHSLQLRVDLAQSFYSCYLCEQYGGSQYCGAISPDAIYLTLDAQTNLQILLLDDQDQPVALRQYDVESDLGLHRFIANLTLPVTDLNRTAQCGTRLRLLVAALFTIDEPVNKDLYALAYTPGASAINCTPHALYEAMSIDCAATPLLYPIIYDTVPCVTLLSGGAAEPALPTILYERGALYWFYTLVFDNTTTLPPDLCGEPLDALLFRTQLYQQQCYGVRTAGACEWWNDLLTRYLVLWLNAERDRAGENTVMRATLEAMRAQLERTCNRRNSCLVVPLAPVRDLYTDGDDGEDNETLCLALRDYFEAHYREAESDFLALFGAWYRSTFHALIYPDRAFITKAMLFAMCVFFTLLFLVFGVGVAGFRMRIKVRKPTLT